MTPCWWWRDPARVGELRMWVAAAAWHERRGEPRLSGWADGAERLLLAIEARGRYARARAASGAASRLQVAADAASGPVR